MRGTILGASIAILLANPVAAQTGKNADVSKQIFDVITYHSLAGEAEPATGYWASLVNHPKSACTNCHVAQAKSGNSNVDVMLNLATKSVPDPSGQKSVGDWLIANSNIWNYHNQANGLTASHLFPGAANTPTVGAVLEVPGTATRSMLNLPADSGIVVRGVCEPLSKNLGGLKANDIVLSVNDKPAKSASELDGQLAANGKLAMVVLRDGEKMQLNRDSAGTAEKKRYLIGVTLGELDPVVRAQMKLDDKVTVFVRDLAEDGAAKSAGVQPHDIFLKINGQPVPDVAAVRSMVQQSNGKELKTDLRRGSRIVKVRLKPRLTGEVQAVLVDGKANRIRLVDVHDKVAATESASPEQLQSRLNAIDQKLNELMTIIKSLKSDE